MCLGDGNSFIVSTATTNNEACPHQALVADLHPFDVVCGRTKEAYASIGNRRLRVIISINLPKYMQAESRIDKSILIVNIVEQIKECGGRFLKRKGDQWVEVGVKEARNKVSHDLRNRVAKASKKPTLSSRPNSPQIVESSPTPPETTQLERVTSSFMPKLERVTSIAMPLEQLERMTSFAMPLEQLERMASFAMPPQLERMASFAMPLERLERMASFVMPLEQLERATSSTMPLEQLERVTSIAMPLQLESVTSMAMPPQLESVTSMAMPPQLERISTCALQTLERYHDLMTGRENGESQMFPAIQTAAI